MKIAILGATGGIGSAILNLLHDRYDVVAMGRESIDFSSPSAVEVLDLTPFDCIINCVGFNVGAHKGWLKNEVNNQICSVNVNFLTPLLLVKHYINSRTGGRFIYFTSTNIDDPIAYNIFYTASKEALAFSIKTIAKEFPSFVFNEIRLGKVKTKMLNQNYGLQVTQGEIDEMYKKTTYLQASAVANLVSLILNSEIKNITIYS